MTQDAFTLTYQRKEYDWSVGRIPVVLSPLLPVLTTNGAAARMQPSNYGVRAFAGETTDGRFTAGAALDYKAGAATAQVGLQGIGGQTFATAEGTFSTPQAKVGGAFAINLGTHQFSTRFQADYKESWGSLNATYARTSAGWSGQGKGSQSLQTKLALQPSKDLTFGAFANVVGVSELQTTFGVSMSARTPLGAFGAHYTLTPTSHLLQGTFSQPFLGGTLDHNASMTYLRGMDDALFQYSATAKLKHPKGTVDPTLSVNFDTRTQRPIVSAGVKGTATVLPDLSLNYAVHIADLVQGKLSATVGGKYKLNPETELTAQLGSTDFGLGKVSATVGAKHNFSGSTQVAVQLGSSDLGRRQMQASLDIKHKLNDTTQLTMGATTSHTNGNWQVGARLAARVTFDVPMHERLDIAQLSGRIADDEGRGVPNVILRAGSTATVTDANGRYAFLALTPGITTVSALVGDSSEELLFNPELPVTLTLASKEKRVLNIQVKRAARVRGQLALNLPPNNTLQAGGLMPEVPDVTSLSLVLTDSAGKSARINPTSTGTFRFPRLSPGRYTLSLAPETAARLARHEVVLPGPVELGSGEEGDLNVTITLRPREIHFEEAEDLTPVENAP
ncbi:hypothetical protein GCM10008955_10960 [Deinococcus malanensis]|uniref:Carboxypeptidase regulatory-like domain-containing protein n=1 Tax=Deinococcus malanensis TaxID=1706855 RepID=A0ABQ2EPZ5_9DEIO|nr:hypothetical protein GCM10008955_10960 [Deinococcus malanensis]